MTPTKLRILAVEDNPADYRLLKEYLKEGLGASFEVKQAENFEEAHKLFASVNFDVIFLDLNLPDSRGLEGLEKIAALEMNAAVIVLTGLNDKETGLQAIKKHAADYLVKGQINANILARTIRYAIERKRIENDLKQSEVREKEALAIATAARTAMDTLQAMGEAVLLMDMNGVILSINPALERLSGYHKIEAIGKPFSDFLTVMLEEKDQPLAFKAYQAALKGKDFELPPFTVISKQGTAVPIIPAITFIRASDGNPTAIVLTMRDISEIRAMQKDLEENNARLRALAERLSSTEERERRRISAQIHDTVIQTLSLSNIKLGALLKELAADANASSIASVKAVRAAIEDAIRESRSLMAELTPPLLYELGLVPAIDDLAQKLQQKHNTPIQVRDDAQSKPLDKSVQAILFQATRELILNALKHAGACAITVNVSRENDRLRICVADNGAGFSVPEDGRFMFHSSGGFGLFAIRERLEGIGGSLVINSRAGAGTSVLLYVPLD